MSRSGVRADGTLETAPEAHVIVRVPGVHGGEPVIRGTRVTVRSIVIAYERSGDIERVAQSFTVGTEDVRAALAYYADHKPEIDAIIAQRERDATA